MDESKQKQKWKRKKKIKRNKTQPEDESFTPFQARESGAGLYSRSARSTRIIGTGVNILDLIDYVIDQTHWSLIDLINQMES